MESGSDGDRDVVPLFEWAAIFFAEIEWYDGGGCGWSFYLGLWLWLCSCAMQPLKSICSITIGQK